MEFNENLNISGRKKSGFWASRALTQSDFLKASNDLDNPILTAVPDSYGITLLLTTHDHFPFWVDGQRFKEIIVTRISNNIWTILGKINVQVSSSAARFERTYYISRKLFLIRSDPVCFTCSGKQVHCSSIFVCQGNSSQRSQTIIELDYKEETSKKMEIFPYTQHQFNYLEILSQY